MPIISEDDFLKLIATRPAAQGLNSSPAGKKVPTTPKSSSQRVPKIVKTEPEARPTTTTTTTPSKKKSPEPKKIDPKQQTTSTSSKKLEVVEGNGEAQLPWVEKYKPTNLKQVIGKERNIYPCSLFEF